MSASRPELVERRRGERRAPQNGALDVFLTACISRAARVQVQTFREFLEGRIVEQNDQAILINTTTGLETMVCKSALVSVARTPSE